MKIIYMLTTYHVAYAGTPRIAHFVEKGDQSWTSEARCNSDALPSVPENLHVRGHASDNAIGVSVFSNFEINLNANHIASNICWGHTETSPC